MKISCHHVVVALLLVASSSVASPSPASAQSTEQRLESIRELIFGARYGRAIEAAGELLGRDDLSAVDRNAALEVLAIAQIADRRDAARQTLELLYRRDPGHRLTDADASPPVIGAFARARESAPPPVTVGIEHTPPRLTRREPPVLRVRLTENADAVAELRLLYRIGGEGTARVVMTPRDDGTYSARIPVVGSASSATDVAYHIVALAPSLTPLASAGTEAEPLQLRIPAEGGAATGPRDERPPGWAQADEPAAGEEGGGGGSVLEEWWFWTIIVAVVGGGVAAGVVLGTMQSPDSGTLGTVSLMQLEF